MTEKSEWTLTTFKEHIEAILVERDHAFQAHLVSSQVSLDKTDERLDLILQEFPQIYGHKSDIDNLQAEISNIKLDHVQRREFNILKEDIIQNRGARAALYATAGVITALIAVALGAMYANQIDHRDISEQISIESPWLADKPQLERQINKLQDEVIALKAQLAANTAADKAYRATTKK